MGKSPFINGETMGTSPFLMGKLWNITIFKFGKSTNKQRSIFEFANCNSHYQRVSQTRLFNGHQESECLTMAIFPLSHYSPTINYPAIIKISSCNFPIWRFPKMVVPQNHPWNKLFINHSAIGVPPWLWTPLI